MQVNAITAVAPDAPLERTTIERREVGEHEVRIAIKFAGICHSDIHTVRAEWGSIDYPIVVGHEIAGSSRRSARVSRSSRSVTTPASGVSSTPAASVRTARPASTTTAPT